MTAVLFFLHGIASAGVHEVGLAAGSASSIGLKTRIPVHGVGGSVVYRYRGEGRSGLQLEFQDLWQSTNSGREHLLGFKSSWTRIWSSEGAPRTVYSQVGLGGYSSDVLPVLPILWLEAGLGFDAGPLHWRVGPELYSLPPIFVGGGLRVSTSLAIGESS